MRTFKKLTRNIKVRQVNKVLVFADHGPVELTHKELETLHWLSRGLTDKAIAMELKKSDRTIEAAIGRLKKKLRCKTRTALAVTSYKYCLGLAHQGK